MKMRLKNGRWFAAFRHKRKWQGQSLGAYKDEVHKAIINLGKLLEKLERGENPTDLKRKFKDALPTYYEWASSEGGKTESTLKDNKGRLKSKILPVFEDLSIGDITPALLKQYKLDREEQDAPKSTITKELRVIKDICERFNPIFKMPKFTKWVNRGKREAGVLDHADVIKVSGLVLKSSEEFGETYQKIFILMSFTGLSVSDAVNLKRSQIGSDDFIQKQRAKTGEDILIFLCDEAKEVINSVKVTDLKNPDLIFRVPNNKAVTTAIRRTFAKAGVAGSCKSLRHYAASNLLDVGVPEKVVGLILGHAPGSRITQTYLHAKKETIKKGFQALGKQRVGGIKQ
jgi:integrase